MSSVSPSHSLRRSVGRLDPTAAQGANRCLEGGFAVSLGQLLEKMFGEIDGLIEVQLLAFG